MMESVIINNFLKSLWADAMRQFFQRADSSLKKSIFYDIKAIVEELS